MSKLLVLNQIFFNSKRPVRMASQSHLYVLFVIVVGVAAFAAPVKCNTEGTVNNIIYICVCVCVCIVMLIELTYIVLLG